MIYTSISKHKLLLSWMSYDFGNSAYALLIPASLFPLFLKDQLFGVQINYDLAWGLITALSMLVTGLAAPVIGATGDATNTRISLFRWTALLSILFTALLALPIHAVSLLGIILIYLFGAIVYNLSISFYDSLLINVSSIHNRGAISGLGWGFGYLGGVVCLAFVFPFLSTGEASKTKYGSAFLITAIFFCIFSLPTLINLIKTENEVRATSPLFRRIAIGYRTTLSTIRQGRTYGNVFLFLLFFYLIGDGITALYLFSTLFASNTLHIGIKEIMILLVIVQVVGFVATVVFGYISDKLTLKRTLFIFNLFWIFIVCYMAAAHSRLDYIVLSVALGLAMGPTQSACRAALAQIVPAEKKAEFFGFNTLAGKVATIFAPLLFGIVSSITKSQRLAVLSLNLFFLIAIILLRSIKLKSE